MIFKWDSQFYIFHFWIYELFLKLADYSISEYSEWDVGKTALISTSVIILISLNSNNRSDNIFN